MKPETESPKVEILKLPDAPPWRDLLKHYHEIVKEEINEKEEKLSNEHEKNLHLNEIPRFLDHGPAALQGTEEKYVLLILGDLFEKEELNSHEHTLSMHDSKHYDLDIINYRGAWNRVSNYLTDFNTLLNDTNEICEDLGYEFWEKPSEFYPINPELQMRLVPNG